ncbi:MAG: hypothetical protein FWF15_00420 [Oscillospiraceae bacterium]|nr:hypothetical protein [Oscillospiraceae bacterium]
MKKILLIGLAFIMIFAVLACRGKEEEAERVRSEYSTDGKYFIEGYGLDSELLILYPEAVPDKNRPDPYFTPQRWISSTIIEVSFTWYLENDMSEFSGKYFYDVLTDEITTYITSESPAS